MPTQTDIAAFSKAALSQSKCTIESTGMMCAAVRHGVGQVKLYSEGVPDRVAHATGTYAILSKK